MKKKGAFERIRKDAWVGFTMAYGTIKISEEIYKNGQEVGPAVQEYVGIIGSGGIEYGLPVLWGIFSIPVIYDTLKAYDRSKFSEEDDGMYDED